MWDLHVFTPCPASSTKSCALLGLKEDALLTPDYSYCASAPLTTSSLRKTSPPNDRPLPLFHYSTATFLLRSNRAATQPNGLHARGRVQPGLVLLAALHPAQNGSSQGAGFPGAVGLGLQDDSNQPLHERVKQSSWGPSLSYFSAYYISPMSETAQLPSADKFFLPVTFLIHWVLSVHSQRKQTGSQNDSQDWGSSWTFYGRFISLLLLTQPLLSIRKSRVLDLPRNAGQSSERTVLTLAKRPSLLHTSGGKTKQN